ncbi:MAG: flagellar basal body rod protein FlgC [Planctomycetes bacterium]|jgi:flagellar basal-body rod protein FlgC|nr:flagellar basal body rod protein FlgC [Planctomycetota bacterium]
MFPALDVSTSALTAQRMRLNAISSNIANMSTTRNEAGESKPYDARYVVFETAPEIGKAPGAAGVKVKEIGSEEQEPIWKFQPGHQDAVKEGPRAGWVAYPRISLMTEFTDAIEATRAYEANVGVIEVTKDISQQTLRILA